MQATHPASDAPFQQLCGSSHSAACIDGEMSLTQGEGCRETSAGTGTATSTIELAQRSRTSSQSSPVYRENGTVFIEEARESWAAATRSGLEPPAAVPVSRPMHVNLGGTVQLLCPPILQEYLSHVIGGALGAAWAVPAAANQQGTLSPEAAAELQESAARGMQAFLQWLDKGFPFVSILVAVLLYQYLWGVAVCAWLLLCQMTANSILVDAVSRNQPISRKELARHLLLNVVNTLLVLGVTAHQKLHRLLLFRPPLATAQPTVWHTLLLVLLADLLVQLSSMAPKLLLVAALKGKTGGGGSPRNQQRQARLLTCHEYLVSTYRALLPVRVWCCYLAGATSSWVLSGVLVCSYLFTKSFYVAQRVQLLMAAAQLATHTGGYGVLITPAQAGDAASCCPVCQDPAEHPVRLACRHVFCEKCITSWLDRHTTCPMCRKTVKPCGLEMFGDGSSPMLPFLF